MNMAFQFDHYLLRRQVLALTGKFRLYNPDGQLVLFSQQKMFKLKEDIRVYSDESQSQEILLIKARTILDFSAAYDVIDAQANAKVGTWRRKGMRSLLRDEWDLLDVNDRPVGTMLEDNMTQALLRRFLLGKWLPQNYDILMNGQRVADLRQRFNLFRYELDLDISMDTARCLDHRLGVAGAILLATIEGRQE
ncbi:MAG: hypothetical protein EHM70_01180 [Chloroflexota bacterium]|nr:MAG: hypothetical protein EHM70_01180 [Chloroflexota bacterium]